MSDRGEAIRARLLAIFRTEAEEHLATIGANLLALEQGEVRQGEESLLEATFRVMHTLKGAARSVGITEVERRCQELESLLSGLARGREPMTPAALATLREGLDAVTALLEEGGAGSGPAPADGEASVRAEARPGEAGPAPTVRLAAGRLEGVLLRAEELLALKLGAGERVRELEELREELGRLRRELARARPGGPVRDAGERQAARLAEVASAVRETERQAQELHRRALRDHQAMAGTIGGLVEELRELRLAPVATVLGSFPRMVRDLAAARGKEAAWSVQGGDLAVDRAILEVIKESLLHLVRNAVDHGLELPEERRRTGKPVRGTIQVTVEGQEGGWIAVRVEDDGRGIDPARIREAAVRARLGSGPELEALPLEEILPLVYRSGLSTSPMITDLSGHGLGLAIVKERVERLGGRVALETAPGGGAAFCLLLPATVASFRGLLVGAGGQRFLVPLETVVRVERVGPEGIGSLEGRPILREAGVVVPIGPLAGLLDLPEGGADGASGGGAGKRWCLILRAGGQLGGVFVDEVEGDVEVLVKEFAPPLVRVRHVAGAGLLGSGQLVLILRAPDLLATQRSRPGPLAPRPAGGPAAAPRTILVVDDSITTRTMEQSLLEGAGYRVRVAADGIGAWTILRSEPVALVLSDVDMPRLDGFELTARIRADARLADLPVVLVTALESREDKERGIAVGANAYVLKSSFDQTALLEIIRRLV